VNGAGFRSHGTSSADEERNALRLTAPVARCSASRWPDAGPACADFDLARPFTLQPQPKSALSSRTSLTDFCNRKPKLEHAYERSSPRLRRAFHTKELRFRGARATRTGYPAGHAPVTRACLRIDRSAAEPAWCKAPEPTRPLNQTPLSQARDSSHWRAMNWFQSSPRSAFQPAARTDRLSNEPGCLQPQGNPPSFDPARPA
jgi:hypothetical protein